MSESASIPAQENSMRVQMSVTKIARHRSRALRPHNSSVRLALNRLAATRRQRERNAALDQRVLVPHLLDVYELAVYGNTPLLVRVAERLAAALWAIDEMLAMFEVEDGTVRDAVWIEPQIRDAYDHINGILKMISN